MPSRTLKRLSKGKSTSEIKVYLIEFGDYFVKNAEWFLIVKL